MLRFVKRLRNEEQGAIMIMVAVSLVMIFAFAVLTIDISLIELSKTQLQNAADAAVLAAVADYARSGRNQTLATNTAITIAGRNRAYEQGQDPVTITAADVTFPGIDTVRVRTHRTHATADAAQLFFLRVINAASDNLGDMTAVAAAAITGSSTVNCMKPWIFPDKWTENSVPPNDLFDPGVDTYDGSGYEAPGDVGTYIKLFFDNGKNPGMIKSGWYQALDFGNGANCYRNAIESCLCVANCCNDITFSPGDTVTGDAKPGAMVGPTTQGLKGLIDQDPGAYYDASSKTILGSAFGPGLSPRLVPVATYDPTVGFLANKKLVIKSFVVIFVEGYDKDGNVWGRFMEKYQPDGDPNGQPGFVYTTKLIQ